MAAFSSIVSFLHLQIDNTTTKLDLMRKKVSTAAQYVKINMSSLSTFRLHLVINTRLQSNISMQNQRQQKQRKPIISSSSH